MDVLLSATDLNKTYISGGTSVAALRAVTLVARRGELTCVSGISGCGKSTLVNVCAGIVEPDSGDVSIDGRSILDMSHQDRSRIRLERIGMVFQSDMLIEEFSAVENVAFPLELAGSKRAQAAMEAEQALAALGIEELSDRLPEQMSGGQRQRVSIARCLVGRRDLLLADEPTASLDSANAVTVFAALRRAADTGRAVVAVTHDARLHTFADTVIEMLDGEVISANADGRGQP